ncbi:DUF4760 domain-containing protein [Lysobacter sp. 5GHs7-4]|uniref:DUF4760 domain-containing protein n=1 Tax=Lysobacter sp. 5GHs7-4 TaxID=2904253 RepID=UPI001E404B46|nr:DUF4760 domain-containing protein [Lysobacter sp. 5GHs7-4]UHQ22785.1 DUF4760 domain-containing protein [Lysobacter sp. 5GHs7-4]
MEFVFKDLKASQSWAWLSLILAGVLVTFLISSSALSDAGQGGIAIAAYAALAVYFWPCLLKAAHEDHRHLLTVIIWSFVLVILGIALSFYAFFAIAGEDHVKYDKLLNVVPVFVAIWAAAVGWLIHFKLTTKAHRTNNAFVIIMETRKSAEFLKRVETVSRHFPPGSKSIPPEYEKFFSSQAVKAILNDPTTTEGDKLKAEAVVSLRYVLNYYEFMAVGIKAGDLDETLIYDTIHPAVCALFDRSKILVDFISNPDNPGGDRTHFCELKLLVAEWKRRRTAADASALAATQ